MRWWCSARLGEPWTWQWQAYPGVWLFIVTLGAAYAWRLCSRPPRTGRWWVPRSEAPRGGAGRTVKEPQRAAPTSVPLAADERPTSAREIALFSLGLAVLWAGADWPVGVLAAGYLLSVKTVQYLLIGYIGPGLLLLGTPRWLLRRMIRGRVAFAVARALTRPLIPLAVANGVLVATHLPVVVDNLSGSQLWTFVLDLIVIGTGFIFWWPALGRLPELHAMSYGARIGYLGLNLFLPTVPASFFTFSQYPIYALYELAPRVSGISAVADQRVAGLLMKTCGGALLFGTMSVMFFRWYRHETDAEPEHVRTPSQAGEHPGG